MLTGKPGYQQVSVYDIEDYTVSPESNTQDIDFTRSQCALAATWRTAVTSGKAPVRYEWTVGIAGQSKGGDLIDQSEPLWRETGNGNMALYTTRTSQKSGKTTEVLTFSSLVLTEYCYLEYN